MAKWDRRGHIERELNRLSEEQKVIFQERRERALRNCNLSEARMYESLLKQDELEIISQSKSTADYEKPSEGYWVSRRCPR